MGERTANLIRRERKLQKLSADDLAQVVGISRTGLTMIETQRSHGTFATLARIADALCISRDKIARAAMADALERENT